MERGRVVFALLFLAVPLLALAGIPMLTTTAGVSLLFLALLLLLVGFTIAIPFIDLDE